ncbi:MAG TPA: hypothetical protein VJV23_03880 [Candidatus Polarisedimenticolia bacterium]|nr:hypothetical protein [Candidatus Polarisedimenticolia bacterium]
MRREAEVPATARDGRLAAFAAAPLGARFFGAFAGLMGFSPAIVLRDDLIERRCLMA